MHRIFLMTVCIFGRRAEATAMTNLEKSCSNDTPFLIEWSYHKYTVIELQNLLLFFFYRDSDVTPKRLPHVMCAHIDV